MLIDELGADANAILHNGDNALTEVRRVVVGGGGTVGDCLQAFNCTSDATSTRLPPQ